MKDFQTWLITQVTAARGAACQFPSELPVCPGCSVYNSPGCLTSNTGHLKQPKQDVSTCFSVHRCHDTELATCFSKDRENAKIGPVNCHLSVKL